MINSVTSLFLSAALTLVQATGNEDSLEAIPEKPTPPVSAEEFCYNLSETLAYEYALIEKQGYGEHILEGLEGLYSRRCLDTHDPSDLIG